MTRFRVKCFDLRQGLKLHTSMSFRSMLFRRSQWIPLLLVLISAPTAFGQLKDAQGNLISPVAFVNQEAITTTFVSSPNVGSSSGSSSNEAGQWLKVEIHYGTTSFLTTKYLDSVQFKIWIEGLDLLAKDAPVPGKGVAIGLTGDVTYVNIPAGKDLYAVFYVHPSTLDRYSSNRGTEDFERKFDVHVEAYVNGVLMDKIDKNKEQDPNWFQTLKAVPNLVYRQNQSPFFLSDVDRYPAIELPASK